MEMAIPQAQPPSVIRAPPPISAVCPTLIARALMPTLLSPRQRPGDNRLAPTTSLADQIRRPVRHPLDNHHRRRRSTFRTAPADIAAALPTNTSATPVSASSATLPDDAPPIATSVFVASPSSSAPSVPPISRFRASASAGDAGSTSAAVSSAASVTSSAGVSDRW